MIYCYTDPKELLFIAIDGPAPRSKMSQQRRRRYKSICEKNNLWLIEDSCDALGSTYEGKTSFKLDRSSMILFKSAIY